jgi:hypothetical protein
LFIRASTTSAFHFLSLFSETGLVIFIINQPFSFVKDHFTVLSFSFSALKRVSSAIYEITPMRYTTANPMTSNWIEKKVYVR